MNHVKVFVVLFFSMFYLSGTTLADRPDNTLLRYYSAFLSVNLNHALGGSRIIYHLSKRSTIDKKFLESEIGKIKQDIELSNNDIANIIINTMDDKKKEIDKFLKNIDEHLSQISIDLNLITSKMNKQENFSSLVSDVFYQINKAETEDNSEIARILELKKVEDPLLVIPNE